MTQSKTDSYKQTPLGLIPIEWEVKRIGKMTKSIAGGTPATSKREYWGGDIKWMSSGELNLKRVYDVEGRITQLGLNSSSTRLIPPKCVLIGLAGQGKTRGTVAMNMVELCTNQSVAAILPSKEFNEDFLYHNLDSRYDELRQLSTGDGGRGGLNLNIINSVQIPLPPPPEQRAIAHVLSTWDEAINKTQALIAQKELRKKWLMQMLLTVKKRLRGYKGEWLKLELGKACELITKGTTPTSIGQDFKNQGINFIKIESLEENGTIIPNKVAFISEEAHRVLNRSQLKSDDILISIAGALGRVAIVKKEILPANTNQALAIVRLRKNGPIVLPFLFYYLTSSRIKKVIEAINVQAAQANLSLANINDFIIHHPLSEEQTAIAKVLQAADKEVALLKAKVEKLKAQKKGLMQMLLTGKKRLKVSLT